MKAEDIQPRLNYVVVQRTEASGHTPGGLALPESVVKKENITVKVIAVGPGTFAENAERIPMDLEPGDYALLHPTAMFFEIPGMPDVAITADDAIVALVPAEAAWQPEFESKIIA